MNNNIPRSCPKCKSLNLSSNSTSFLRCKDCNYSWFTDSKKNFSKNFFDIELITYKFKKNKKITYILIGIIFLFFVLSKNGFNSENLEAFFSKLISILISIGILFIAGKIIQMVANMRFEASKCSECGTPNSYELVDQQWHGNYWVGEGLNRETKNIYKNTYRCSNCGNQYWRSERSWFN